MLLAASNGPNLGRDSLIVVIHSAGRLHSDGEKTRVLTRIAQRYQIAQALRNAAKSIQSDGEYRRVMSQLARTD